jgi:hypothetical protein
MAVYLQGNKIIPKEKTPKKHIIGWLILKMKARTPSETGNIQTNKTQSTKFHAIFLITASRLSAVAMSCRIEVTIFSGRSIFPITKSLSIE